jgi:hypothetical protein
MEMRKLILIDPKLIAPSPIGPPLTPEQIARAEASYSVVSEVLKMPLPKFLEGFQRDLPQFRDQEISFWESIAKTIQEWIAANPASTPATRKQALKALLHSALGESTGARTN